MVVRFDLFSSGRLYKALQEAKYPDLPAERTLRDWIKNDSAPEGARLFVTALLQADIAKEPPPDWARELLDAINNQLNRDEVAQMVDAIQTRVLTAIGEGRADLIEAIAERVAERSRQQLSQQHADAERGGNPGQGQGSKGPSPAPAP